VDVDARGDERDPDRGFSAAYLQQLPQLRRVVAGTGFDAADAEDILQDVYLQASQRPGEYRGAAEAKHWLLRVTVNRCLLEYRRRRRFRRAAEEILRRPVSNESGNPGDPPGGSATVDELESVRRGLRQMDGRAGALLVLRYFCELDATQIGEILQWPPSTVRSRLRLARLELAEMLKERGSAT
jgi:RNA polymerase sigma factor (sigma-70 family)